MESKYRAGDDRPPSYTSPSTTVGYVSDLAALRAGYSQTVDFMQNPSDVREAIHLREMEKQRIREELIAEEIARRAVLEAEVRRELMVEREISMRRAGEIGVSSEEIFSMQSDSMPFMRHFNDCWFEKQRAFTSRCRRDPLLPPPVELLRLPERPCTEGKASSESQKDKSIVLPRPDSNISEKKQKASPESVVQALPSTSSKKPKEEWSCALCQVSATSEKGLNEHLRGKKHKAKEERLRDSEQKLKSTDKDPELPLENQGAETSGNENSEKLRTALELKNKRKFKFWCEMCSVGAYSKVVMDDHGKGKGHRSRLEKLEKNSEALSTPTSISSTFTVIAEVNQMAKDENIVANEANKNTEEGIGGANGSCPSPLMVLYPAEEDIIV